MKISNQLLTTLFIILLLILSLPSLGQEWLAADIGAPAATGNHEWREGVMTISGAGKENKDQGHYVYYNVPAGDIELIARLTSLAGLEHAQAGLMMRENNNAKVATAEISLHNFTATNATRHSVGWSSFNTRAGRRDQGGANIISPLPIWLKIVRLGNHFGAYKSVDGKIWTIMGSVSGGEFTLDTGFEVGFFVASNDADKTATAIFDNFYAGAPRLEYHTSWIGNTFGQAVSGHVSNSISSLWVGTDGSCYTNSYWDEGSEASKVYKDGKVVKAFRDGNEAFGNAFCGEGTITGDGTNMYLAVRTNLFITDLLGTAKATRPLYFSEDLWYKDKNISVVSGMAVVNGELFVSNARDQKVMVAHTDTPQYYTAGNSSTNRASEAVSTEGVANAAPAELYQTQRDCDYLPYRIPDLDPKISYTVRSHFAEFKEDKAGARLMDIGASHAKTVKNYDIFVAAGGKNKAAVLDLPDAKADANGILTVIYSRSSELRCHLVICGFEIITPEGAVAFAVNSGGAKINAFRGETYDIPERAFNVTRPGPMTADKRGDLWIIQQAGDFPLGTAPVKKYPAAVRCYKIDGTFTGKEISDVENPTAVAYDAVNDRLLVADNGADLQVRIYDTLAKKLRAASRFGIKGGLYTGEHPGRLFDEKAGGWARLYALNGVGIDAEGNIYTSCNGAGTDLRKFKPDGTLVWKLNSLHFVDCADFDPDSDGTKVYCPFKQYSMDYSKTEPGSEWDYQSYTWDPKYGPPQRGGSSSAVVRRVGPKRTLMLYSSGQGQVGYVGIFRFDGDITVPAGRIKLIAGGKFEIWNDLNADGLETPDELSTCPGNGGGFQSYSVDKHGDIWLACISMRKGILRHFRFLGLSEKGVPKYGVNPEDYEDVDFPGIGKEVSGWGQVVRVSYDADRDIMYLIGPAETRKNDKEDPITYLARYDKWSEGNREAKWLITLPNPATDPNFPTFDRPYGLAFHWMAFDVAVDKIFVAEMWGPIHVYDAETGLLDTILNPGPEVSAFIAWEDEQMGVRAFKRKNGEYIIFSENSGFGGKNNMWRWKPE